MKPGDFLGRYEIKALLARGGMAEVWLALARGVDGFQKNVVLKTILPELAENPDFVRMFINEALLAARLNHPNIVQIFDLGCIDGSYFIAMEHVPGRSLRQISRACRKKGELVPPWFVLRTISAVAEGLQSAHDLCDDEGRPLGMVHRDVTPENVMISFRGVVKILDFGVAKANAATSQTKAGTLKGKYAYISPEQIRGAMADRRSDIYAVGVILYEMLTGVRPFWGQNDLDLLRMVVNGNPSPPRSVSPWIPEELERIIMKAMAADLNQRYIDAGQLGEDLLVFLERSHDRHTQADMGLLVSYLFPDEPNIPSDVVRKLSANPAGLRVGGSALDSGSKLFQEFEPSPVEEYLSIDIVESEEASHVTATTIASDASEQSIEISETGERARSRTLVRDDSSTFEVTGLDGWSGPGRAAVPLESNTLTPVAPPAAAILAEAAGRTSRPTPTGHPLEAVPTRPVAAADAEAIAQSMKAGAVPTAKTKPSEPTTRVGLASPLSESEAGAGRDRPSAPTDTMPAVPATPQAKITATTNLAVRPPTSEQPAVSAAASPAPAAGAAGASPKAAAAPAPPTEPSAKTAPPPPPSASMPKPKTKVAAKGTGSGKGAEAKPAETIPAEPRPTDGKPAEAKPKTPEPKGAKAPDEKAAAPAKSATGSAPAIKKPLATPTMPKPKTKAASKGKDEAAAPNGAPKTVGEAASAPSLGTTTPAEAESAQGAAATPPELPAAPAPLGKPLATPSMPKPKTKAKSKEPEQPAAGPAPGQPAPEQRSPEVELPAATGLGAPLKPSATPAMPRPRTTGKPSEELPKPAPIPDAATVRPPSAVTMPKPASSMPKPSLPTPTMPKPASTMPAPTMPKPASMPRPASSMPAPAMPKPRTGAGSSRESTPSDEQRPLPTSAAPAMPGPRTETTRASRVDDRTLTSTASAVKDRDALASVWETAARKAPAEPEPPPEPPAEQTPPATAAEGEDRMAALWSRAAAERAAAVEEPQAPSAAKSAASVFGDDSGDIEDRVAAVWKSVGQKRAEEPAASGGAGPFTSGSSKTQTEPDISSGAGFTTRPGIARAGSQSDMLSPTGFATRAGQTKDTREAWDARDTKDSRDSRDSRGAREGRDAREDAGASLFDRRTARTDMDQDIFTASRRLPDEDLAARRSFSQPSTGASGWGEADPWRRPAAEFAARYFPPDIAAAKHFEDGLSYLRKGEFEQALREWEEAVSLDPEKSIYQKNLNLLRKRIESDPEAGGAK